MQTSSGQKHTMEWKDKFLDGNDSQRKIHPNGRIIVSCRKCAEYSTTRMVSRLRNMCQRKDERTQRDSQNLWQDDVRYQMDKRKERSIEGKTTKHASEESKVEEVREGTVTQCGFWHIVEEKIRKAMIAAV